MSEKLLSLEIVRLNKRITELEADATISQEFQTDVLSPLFDQLEQAGYAGTWSQKVAAVLNPWIAVEERLPEDGIFVLTGITGYTDEYWPGKRLNNTWRGKCGKPLLGINIWMPLPLPPESEGK
jgi:hypothetical protein